MKEKAYFVQGFHVWHVDKEELQDWFEVVANSDFAEVLLH